jgi:hypothetical protein
MSVVPIALLVSLWVASPAGHASKYFKIAVVDEQTGRGVPLVELRTVNNVRYYTDSNGIVAFYEPGLMDRSVFFHVESHGYEFPKDGFGYRGKAIRIMEGGGTVLNIKRVNIAERLYRVTGAGIYRDSLLVGHPAPIQHPLLNGKVFGSDSVVNAVYRGKIYWFWGDTNRPGYPLGNFHVPGATSMLPENGGLDPDKGVDLEYFLDEQGFAKQMARMPGEGPTWISGPVVLRDGRGSARMLASYVKVRNSLEVYRRGLAEFDPDSGRFEQVAEFGMEAPIFPSGHPLHHTVDGVEYVYFADPFPFVRVRADLEHVQNPAAYEAYTCLKQGARFDDPQLDHADSGKLRFGWKRNTPPITPTEQARLIKSGQCSAEESPLRLRNVRTGQPVTAHRGSVYWNEYRGRFVMIAVQQGGDSFLGEVWYAEADTPEGPWTNAVKILTHDRYSFYNPKQHPMFDKHGGRVIYFEGTYVNTFSGNPDRTPRYDYNQIMYRLDLSDPRLRLSKPTPH